MPVRVAFEFVLDALSDLSPKTKPFFGAHSVYVGPQIVFVLREKGRDSDDGVWIATTKEHHATLKQELPSMRSIQIFGPGESGWQIIPSTSRSFEPEVMRACELVLAGDGRIGKVPAPRKPRKVSGGRATRPAAGARRRRG